MTKAYSRAGKFVAAFGDRVPHENVSVETVGLMPGQAMEPAKWNTASEVDFGDGSN